MIEVTVTIPNFTTWPALEADLIAANDKSVDKAKRLLDTTKANFSARSQFEFKVTPSKRQGDTIEGKTETDNHNYVRLNEGFTRPSIVPVRKKALAFYPEYTAGTSPRHLGSRRSVVGGPRVFAQSVRAAIVPAREFDKVAAAAVEKDHIANINAVLAKHFGIK